MHLVSSLAGLAAVSGIAAAQNYNDWSQEDVHSGKAWSDVSNTANDRMRDNVNSRNGQCNYDNAQVRKEWRNMAKEERKSFTDAVQCLHHIPYHRMTDAQKVDYPGVFTRYDEYVATHIQFTEKIHMTADFLAWHRFFIHSLEQDLRNGRAFK